jgi:uncharacterized protein YbjT (DUF2867 family)
VSKERSFVYNRFLGEMGVKVIITGATGMVGEGVLHECLLHPEVQEVLVINRKTCGITHPKLKEIIHANFYDLSSIEIDLHGYQACLFCLGVSSVGMKAKKYYEITYTLTLHVASTLARLNPAMVFCYISGAGTKSSEKGLLKWARVKGKTENDLMKLPFKKAYAFRPGMLHPTTGLKNTLKYYRLFGWLYPPLRRFFPGSVSTLKELGLAMINVVRFGYPRQILEVKDIVSLATR